MGVFNYASYAKVLEKGIPSPNMTKIAKALFEPIISMPSVVNQRGNPYNITSTMARDWYNQTTDIPKNIKVASNDPDVVNMIGDYFNQKIVDNLVGQTIETKMYSAMVELVRHSDLQKKEVDELLQYFYDNDRAEFLGKAFLYAINRDNLQKDPNEPETPVDAMIRIFNDTVKTSYKKPVSINPPDDIEEHELGYVLELYQVYQEKTGEEYARPCDLDSQPRLKNNFNRQRKDYYSAETIHRELRDTFMIDEADGFDLLKEEVFDGVITTCEKDYNISYQRLTAVMEHVTQLSISNNLQNHTLNWVGPGEKKGVCHMLVNDKRLTWLEDEEDD